MDGNRRWAKKRSLIPWQGHKEGVEPVKRAVEFCVENDIPYLSLYAFSTENFKRSTEELNHLFGIIKEGLSDKDFNKLLSHGVKIKFIGERSLFPPDLIAKINETEQQTKNGDKLTLLILFCYGGRQELTASCREIARKVSAGHLKPEAITPELIEEHLWTAGIPSPDLVVRTGGEKRLSNFYPWQSTYSELLFLDKYWPDITKEDLAHIVRTFENRKRNFGK